MQSTCERCCEIGFMLIKQFYVQWSNYIKCMYEFERATNEHQIMMTDGGSANIFSNVHLNSQNSQLSL